MAAGVSQKLTKSLYSERGLRKLLQGLGDAAAGSGYAAIFCNRVTYKKGPLFLSGLRLETGVHVVAGPARTQAQRSMTAARSTGHCRNLSQKYSGAWLNDDLCAFGRASAANELQHGEVKGSMRIVCCVQCCAVFEIENRQSQQSCWTGAVLLLPLA